MKSGRLKKSFPVKLFCLLALLICLYSCSENKEEKAKSHLKKGEEYIEISKYKEAIIEFKNVIQLKPQSALGHYKLGLSYWHLGGLNNIQMAFSSFSKAVDLDPGIIDAQVKLAELYLVSRDVDKAEERVKLVLDKAPENLDAKVLKATILAARNDVDSAINLLKEVIAKGEGDIRGHLVLASIYISQRDFESASRIYEEAVGEKKDDIQPRLGLARIRIMQKDKDSAEKVLKEALQVIPDNVQLLAFLGRFYVMAGRNEDAEKTYKQIVTVDPDDAESYLILADFYGSIGKDDNILITLEEGLGKVKTPQILNKKIAEYFLKEGKNEEAALKIKAILKDHPKDSHALYLRGRLDLLERKFKDAIENLKKSVQSEPRFAEGHLYLGLAYQATNDVNQAKSEFLETLKLAPQMEKARIPLASIYLLTKDYNLALEEVNKVLEKSPINPLANLIAGDIKMQMRKLEEAALHFKMVKENYPDDPKSYAKLGLIYQVQGKDDDAFKEYEKALEKNPLLIDVLRMMVAIHLKNKEPKKAIARINEQLKKVPDNAVMNHLTGRVYWMTGDLENAEKYYRKSMELDEKRVDVYIDLGKIYSKKGILDEAVNKYEEAIKISPKNLAPYMLLGVIYENKKDVVKATETYKKVLELNPKFAPAANNLAWIYVENDGNMDVALSLAETAKEQLPDDPSVSDTLGWIYYKKKTYLKAISLFKESLEKVSDIPSVHYHLGMAYVMKGDNDLAREALQKALDLNAEFPGADEARETLKRISSQG